MTKEQIQEGLTILGLKECSSEKPKDNFTVKRYKKYSIYTYGDTVYSQNTPVRSVSDHEQQ